MVREAKEMLKGEITKLRVAPWQMANWKMNRPSHASITADTTTVWR